MTPLFVQGLESSYFVVSRERANNTQSSPEASDNIEPLGSTTFEAKLYTKGDSVHFFIQCVTENFKDKYKASGAV